MSNRLFKLSLVVLLAGSGLALVQFRVQPAHDLDTYTDEQLQEALFAELDDMPQIQSPDEQYDIEELRSAILTALSDEGDEGDEAEQEIDRADLDEEMSEAETTVGDVVDEALARADELASRTGSPSWTIVQVRFHNAGLSPNAQDRNQSGHTTSRVAIREVASTVISNVRRAPNKRRG